MNERFEESLQRKKRQLSRFFAKEMILDYVERRLDPGRIKAVEDHLAKNKEAQAEVASTRAALEYLDRLANIDVSPQLVHQIETTKVGWSKWAERLAWRNWPELARWSLEAVAIAAVLAGAVSMLPMQRLARFLPRPAQDLILVEVKPDSTVKDLAGVSVEGNEDDADDTIVKAASTDAKAASAEKEPSAPVKPVIAAKPSAPQPSAVIAQGNILKAKPAAKPEPTVAQVAEPAPQAADVAGVEQKNVNSEADEVKSSDLTAESEAETEPAGSKATKGPKGFVYRAFMSASAIDETTSGVRDLVMSLGGQKAGQVELGWRKTSGTYFHFALPQSNYEALLEGLRSFGPVRIYKDPHWRVMPEGQIRLILFIEDVNLKK